MARPQQHAAIAVMSLFLLAVLPVVLPDGFVWVVVGLSWGVALVSYVARGRYGVARAHLRARRYAQAFDEFAAFERQASSSAWRRALGFLYAGFQTSDPIALARGHLGIVRLEQGRLTEAEAFLRAALDQDPDYCLPWANRAIVAALSGDEAAALKFATTAKDLGFRDLKLDAVIADALKKRRVSP